MKVAVVGAGISGLACAWELLRKGFDVEVFEASSRAGGVIATRTAGDLRIELGPTTVRSSVELETLVTELGLGDERIDADPTLPRYVFWDGSLVAAPLGPASLATTRLLSAKAKMRLLREPWIPTRSHAEEEESVRAFFTRRFGEEVHDRLVAPFASGIYAGDTAKLGIASAFPGVARLEAEHGSVVRGALFGNRGEAAKPGRPGIFSFREGLERLPRALGERIRIHFEHAVDDLAKLRGAADRIVVATPAHEAAKLLEPLDSGVATSLRRIESPSLALVAVAYRKADVATTLTGFGFLAPREAGLRVLGCLWSSSLFESRAPRDRVLVSCFVGGATDAEAGQLEDDALVALVHRDLERALGVREPPLTSHIERYPRSIPQYVIGHRERIADLRRRMTGVRGVYLAGNYLTGVSVGDCVRQGFETAREVLGC